MRERKDFWLGKLGQHDIVFEIRRTFFFFLVRHYISIILGGFSRWYLSVTQVAERR